MVDPPVPSLNMQGGRGAAIDSWEGQKPQQQKKKQKNTVIKYFPTILEISGNKHVVKQLEAMDMYISQLEQI